MIMMTSFPDMIKYDIMFNWLFRSGLVCVVHQGMAREFNGGREPGMLTRENQVTDES